MIFSSYLYIRMEADYLCLMLNGRLNEYLHDVDEECHVMEELIGTGLIVCGLNVSGKRTLGKAVAKKQHFHFIDKEDLYEQEGKILVL